MPLNWSEAKADKQYGDYFPSSERDQLRTENAELKRQVEEFRGILNELDHHYEIQSPMLRTDKAAYVSCIATAIAERDSLKAQLADITKLERERNETANVFMAQVKRLQAQLAEAGKRIEKFTVFLANQIGIEKAEPNAGDDPSKEYWIGADQQYYESLDKAIDAAITATKEGQ